MPFSGGPASNAEDIKLYLADPEAARRKLREDWKGALAATPEQAAGFMKSLLSPVDTQAVTGDLAEWLS